MLQQKGCTTMAAFREKQSGLEGNREGKGWEIQIRAARLQVEKRCSTASKVGGSFVQSSEKASAVHLRGSGCFQQMCFKFFPPLFMT